MLYIYWKIFVFKKSDKKDPKHIDMDKNRASQTRNSGLFLDNKDTHGAFTHYGHIDRNGLKALLDNKGNFLRRRNEDWTDNLDEVSGDVVVSFVFAHIFNKAYDMDIKLAIDNYVKFLGTRSYDKINNGDVSNRCNNFGINYCPDSQVLKMGQPMFGPQFYTNSALFASGYHLGLKYKFIFWAHWLVLGGWYWFFAPILYLKNKQLWYVRDITMKALFVHKAIFGNRWWIRIPMNFINNTLTHKNVLFDAMLGNEVPSLPDAMDPFFSQREDASSVDSTDASIYVPLVIKKIKSGLF